MAPGAGPIYQPDERSKGVRLNKRSEYRTKPLIRFWSRKSLRLLTNLCTAHHEQQTIHDIVNASPILHVSFNAPLKSGPPFPTILPMLGAIGQFEGDDEEHVYLHGSSVARLFNLTEGGDEVPLCVCGTILDGYVMALAPFHNSCNYRAAVLFGYGTVVTEEPEVLYALKLITNNTMPDRWDNSRKPPTKSEITSTAVLKVRIETASTKIP